MIQQLNSVPTPLSYFWLRSLLLKSLGCIGFFGFLSSNLVLAQTEASINTSTAPTSQLQLKAPAPRVGSNNQAKWQRLRQKLYSTPAPARRQQLRTAISASPAPVRAIRRKKSNPATTAALKPKDLFSQVKFSPTSQQSVSQVSSVVNQTKFPKLVRAQTKNTDYDGAYIDPTDYKIGATTGYEAPSSVVLSERKTGCKAVVRAGLSGSICGTAKLRRSPRIALRGNRSNIVRLARVPASSWVRNRVAVKSGIRPIQVGSLKVSSYGLGMANNPRTKRIVVAYNGIQPKIGNASTNFMFPLTIPAPITSLFGWRVHPITGDRRFHSGTDLGAPLGTPVLATQSGQVSTADYLGGYGLTVVLDHNKFTQQTLYAHLSEIFVQPGEWVEQGTVIGRVGSTGNSTGPHLHFETRQLTPQGWFALDPGTQLEQAMAQLVEALRIAQSKGVNTEG